MIERTSHIPIILLTARADQAAKIEGLTHGADAYVVKPFDEEELVVRIGNLIELMKTLQEKYWTIFTGQRASRKEIQKEDRFLAKVRQLIIEHIDDPRFNTAQLHQEMNISRTQLHRKLKALTGMSTSRVMRTVRVEKAKELLMISQMNVSEVAYAAGFTNRSHFTQVFSEEYGEPPSHFKI